MPIPLRREPMENTHFRANRQSRVCRLSQSHYARAGKSAKAGTFATTVIRISDRGRETDFLVARNTLVNVVHELHRHLGPNVRRDNVEAVCPSHHLTDDLGADLEPNLSSVFAA
jgi:hypothetical protein